MPEVVSTANLLAVAILFSTLLSIASFMSFNKDISWDFKRRFGAPACAVLLWMWRQNITWALGFLIFDIVMLLFGDWGTLMITVAVSPCRAWTRMSPRTGWGAPRWPSRGSRSRPGCPGSWAAPRPWSRQPCSELSAPAHSEVSVNHSWLWSTVCIVPGSPCPWAGPAGPRSRGRCRAWRSRTRGWWGPRGRWTTGTRRWRGSGGRSCGWCRSPALRGSRRRWPAVRCLNWQTGPVLAYFSGYIGRVDTWSVVSTLSTAGAETRDTCMPNKLLEMIELHQPGNVSVMQISQQLPLYKSSLVWTRRWLLRQLHPLSSLWRLHLFTLLHIPR